MSGKALCFRHNEVYQYQRVKYITFNQWFNNFYIIVRKNSNERTIFGGESLFDFATLLS